MLVRVVAQELRGDHIAVNEIVPGPVRTRLTGFVEESLLPSDQTAQRPSFYPESEWVKAPVDVAPLAVFLATQPTHGPTGQVYSLLGRDG